VPLIINESYKTGKGYLTMWNAADVLSYYGNVLTFIGTGVLGIAVMFQNDKINEREQLSSSYSSLRLTGFKIDDDVDDYSPPHIESITSLLHPSKVNVGRLNISFKDKGKVIPNNIMLKSLVISNLTGEILLELIGTENNRWIKISRIESPKGEIINATLLAMYNGDEIHRLYESVDNLKLTIDIEYANPAGVITKGEYKSWFLKKDMNEYGKWESYISKIDKESYILQE